MTNVPSSGLSKETVTILVTVLIAVLGFVVKYMNDLSIARRRDRLERVNAQLRLLYGPLFALTQASATVWRQFRKEYRANVPYFNESRPPSEDDLTAWHLWMRHAFMPLNRKMVDVIITNADLLEGGMPPEFLSLIAHVTEYETLLERWTHDDFAKYVPALAFPRAIENVVQTEYERLQAMQRTLLASKVKPRRDPAA